MTVIYNMSIVRADKPWIGDVATEVACHDSGGLRVRRMAMSAAALLLLLLAAAHAHSAAAAPLVPAKAQYDYTIDCRSFGKKAAGDTCEGPAGYGNASAWAKVVHRPMPSFYPDMKLGVFIHWGAYSVPSYGSEWFWHNYECTGGGDPGHKGPESVKAFADKNFPLVGSDYPQYADLFHAELYTAADWVTAIKGMGGQYVLPVAKHHDGFCMWNASESSPMWNAAQVGPKRDVLTELYDASVEGGLPFGIYYSQGEWFDKDFVADSKTNFSTTVFIEKKVIPQRLDLVHRFPKAVIWHTDGGWMAPDSYWNNLDWLTYLVTDSPLASKVVSCNSMGVGCCSAAANDKHSVTPAQQSKCWEIGDAPSGGDRTTAGSVTGHFYTNQMTIQRGSWSWDRKEDQLSDFFSASELIWTLISTSAWNGTLIVNIGPTADGRIAPIFLDRFERIGAWLATNGESIYGSRPWRGSLPHGMEGATEGGFAGAANATYYTAGTASSGCQFESTPRHSSGGGCGAGALGVVYGIFMSYPPHDPGGAGSVAPFFRSLKLSIPQGVMGVTKVELLTGGGSSVVLKWVSGEGGVGIVIAMPPPPDGSAHAWTLRMTGLKNA